MKIGISTRGLYQGSYAISTIVLHLSRKLIELAGPSHEIFLYFNDPSYEDLFPSTISKRSFKLKNRFIWDHFWLPQALRKDRVDVALFFKGTMPVMLPCRGAVIFHDLGYFDKQLQPYRPHETLYMKNMMAIAARQACSIFTDSDYTKLKTMKILGADAKKIHTCYEDCSPIFEPVTDIVKQKAIRNRYGLPDKFIFCPVSISPRKNIPRILEAYRMVMDNIPQDIVFTGGQFWGGDNLVQDIKSKHNHRICFLGHVDFEDMPGLYSLADFTLYPSLLEGFGMPVLEAFRCNCPVLTSNITSIPEVAGDAAYLVDPYNINQIADGLEKLATDSSLRQALKTRGSEQAKKFSWEKTAQIILDGLGFC